MGGCWLVDWERLDGEFFSLCISRGFMFGLLIIPFRPFYFLPSSTICTRKPCTCLVQSMPPALSWFGRCTQKAINERSRR